MTGSPSLDEKLAQIEERARVGKVATDDVKWLVEALKAARESSGPPIDPAPPERFAPQALAPASALDECMLELALVFNDLKDIILLSAWLKPHEPTAGEISGYDGEWAGLHNHLTRLAVGILHEFLNLLEKHHGTFASEAFEALLSTTPRDSQRSWKSLLALIDRRTPQGGTEGAHLYNALRAIRNHTAFHYKDVKPLAQGYRDHFGADNPTPQQSHAYASIGQAMESTRFYYADAAAHGHSQRQGQNRDIDIDNLITRTAVHLNCALGPLVANHVARKTGRARLYFHPSDIAVRSRPSSGGRTRRSPKPPK